MYINIIIALQIPLEDVLDTIKYIYLAESSTNVVNKSLVVNKKEMPSNKTNDCEYIENEIVSHNRSNNIFKYQRNIALRISYIGTNYSGLAYQNKTIPTIEKCILYSLVKTKLIKNIDTIIYSRCGRTDSGVHARSQVLSIPLRSSFPYISQRKKFAEKIFNILYPKYNKENIYNCIECNDSQINISDTTKLSYLHMYHILSNTPIIKDNYSHLLPSWKKIFDLDYVPRIRGLLNIRKDHDSDNFDGETNDINDTDESYDTEFEKFE